MLNRFQGDAGHRRLADALSRQTVVNGDAELAARLISSSDLVQYDAGQLLITDGDDLDIRGRYGDDRLPDGPVILRLLSENDSAWTLVGERS